MIRRGLPFALVISVFAIVLTRTAGAQTQRIAAAGRWVTAWSTSHQGLGRSQLTNTTLRLIARTGLAGEAVRIRLDNTFGTAPLVIGKASLGARMRGAGLVPGSNRQVFFGGAPTVTIPPGGTVHSDPVRLKVAARQDLAVSLHVPESNVRPSEHLLALTTSYLTPNGSGDATSAEAATRFTETTTAGYWLKSIDVLSSAPTGSVVAFGDSITDGACAPVDARGTWADWLATRLALETRRDVGVLNEGIGGNTVTKHADIGSPPGVDRLDRDVLSHDGVTHVILFMGTNDIRRGASGAQVIAGITDIMTRVKAHGLRIYGVTIIPRHVAAPGAGNPGWTAENTRIRNEVNRWIRSEAPFDAVIDFDEALRDPTNPDRLQPQFNCDDIHPSALGYFEMARTIRLSLF